ncbi:MAG: hypothetical protein H6510_04730 [Acidobacteria bacterium]|nr:hypothetical protein [Acidobacteriota bacterium]MCB9397102.1 hypothetical protein [Acidobacteriota bacterium]
MLHTIQIALASFCLFSPTIALIQESGNVELPLATYNELVEKGRVPPQIPPTAPTDFALGDAQVQVNFRGPQQKSAEIHIDLTVEVFESKWCTIPMLPSGTPIRTVRMDGSPIQLVHVQGWLNWITQAKGTHRISLDYALDIHDFESGASLALPLPLASATTISGVIPGSGLDVALLPAAGLNTRPQGSDTFFQATIPTSQAVHLSWRRLSVHAFSLARTLLNGQVRPNAIVWAGSIDVEILRDEQVLIPILPNPTTLRELTVDGKKTSIQVEKDQIQCRVSGKGWHTIAFHFEVPIQRSSGPPEVSVPLPAAPITELNLTLDGKKEVQITPAADVRTTHQAKTTIAQAFVPMTAQARISWTEAVPEEVNQEIRMSGDLFHSARAEEGVLYLRARCLVEVTRGSVKSLQFAVPEGAQINEVLASQGGIADWQTKKAKDGNTVEVFLDRAIEGTFQLDVTYEKGLPDMAQPFDLPLIRLLNVHRQRGMLALLATKDFTLKPLEEINVTKVGENQLPAIAKEGIEDTIAHTYKYLEDPRINVQTVIPERKEGKFDAEIDTLISLSDVTLKGSTSIGINIKSGTLLELRCQLPPDTNLLSLTAPSLRTYKVETQDGMQIIDIQFTQEMEGQFRMDAVYERITDESQEDVTVPTLGVLNAEVERGRIGVEALSVMEVQAKSTSQLSSIDLSELPQRVILKTTNPILLAFKYVQALPRPELVLNMTRHREMDTQNAVIDQARFHTLFTRDGLQITSAHFELRNTRKQFLRLDLPPESEIWSVFVAGKAEKPAKVSNEAGEGMPVLIKIINSADGFPVEIVYATPGDSMNQMGAIRGVLPKPDLVVTQTEWEVNVPADFTYTHPQTNMEWIPPATPISSADSGQAESRLREQLASSNLRLNVPESGYRLRFQKIYANQSEQAPMFRMTYTSASGSRSLDTLMILFTVLFWGGLFFSWHQKPKPAWQKWGFAPFGLVVLIVSQVMNRSLLLPGLSSLILVLTWAGYVLWIRETKRPKIQSIQE